MLIWLINHYAVPPQYYPLARQTYFAKNLMARGHKVRIIAASTVHNSDLNLITDGKQYREEVVDGVLYTYIHCHGYSDNGIKRIYNMCEFAWKLPGVCKHFEKPDVIVATSMPPVSCAMGIHMARKYGIRGVAEIADLWPESIVAFGIAGRNNPAVRFLYHLEKWIYTKADAVIFTMEGGRDYIIEQGWDSAHGGPVDLEKVHYINNGVDLEQFDCNKERYVLADADLDDPDTFKVVYAGSIRKVNGVGLLVDAAETLLARGMEKIKILVYGDGDERASLEKRAGELGLTNIVFKGSVDKKYIPSVLSRGSLNVLNYSDNTAKVYRYGCSPNKLFEYLASGRPVLANIPINYSVIRSYGCGVELASNEAGEYADMIVEMSNDADQYAAQCQNSRKAAEEFDFQRLTDKLLEVLG